MFILDGAIIICDTIDRENIRALIYPYCEAASWEITEQIVSFIEKSNPMAI